ncbi:MAG: hypothetical protein GF341_05520 [candidate division Zixibacteria bacterium]|nr:hypothetical protein [candidate division Zixibacteria bacterium]
MTRRGILFSVFVLLTTTALLFGCSDTNVEEVDRGDAGATSEQPQMPDDEIHAGLTGATSSTAGITWTIPDAWNPGPERRMRVATYLIDEGVKEADCAVFYFGPNQGGSVEANIERWIGQFEQPDDSDSHEKAQIEKKTVNGLDVTTIELGGTYNASMGGPMSGNKEKRPGWHMLGAIVEAPEGPVFFKVTGPQETVLEATDEFDRMVGSVSVLGT